ncbi:MAG: DM13 domain-containing protein [Gammaproteobacteria bacterium]
MKKIVLLVLTHLAALAVGFAGGIYALPILIAPEPPATTEVQAMAETAQYTAEFRRDLQDSDGLHWGEGKVFISNTSIALEGSVAPGPDYKLYLSPEFVETEVDFNALKSSMMRVGEVKTFDNFIVELPAGVEVSDYTTVIVWCETFGEFITAAQYR